MLTQLPLLCSMACGSALNPQDAAGIGPCEALRLSDKATRGSLVLIVNDTMRRDRTGIYGGPADTRHFDGFAKSNWLFQHAASSSNWTRPAIASLFTSLQPTSHGVMDDPHFSGGEAPGPLVADILSEDLTTIAEIFASKGFRTAAFVSNPWMDTRFGFGQGFEDYDDTFARWSAPGTAVSEAALNWLNELGSDERFFLYLHYVDSHLPYGELHRDEVDAVRSELAADQRALPKAGVNRLRVLRLEDGSPVLTPGVAPSPQLLEMAYDRGLRDFDRALGLFLDAFADHVAWPDSVVLVTSDHGEALFERGYGNHGRALFEEEVAIPFAARLPRATKPAGEVSCLVSLVDVLPSLCDYFGFVCPESFQGRSFFWRKNTEDVNTRYLVNEGVPHYPRHRAIRNERYKLIYEPSGRLGADSRRSAEGGPWSLFDLIDDPEEQKDLLDPWFRSPGVSEVAAVMQTALLLAVPPASKVALPERRTAPVDGILRERLESLGYLEDVEQSDSYP